VTAAGQGIGRAIAEAFLREGAAVWATDLDEAKLEGLNGAKRRRLDVRSMQAVEALARETGPVDVLANAAGFVHNGTVLECSEQDWDFSFDLNVKSMHRTIKAFLPAMVERGGGSIVNIASVAGSIKGAPNRCVYGATKAAVIGLTPVPVSVTEKSSPSLWLVVWLMVNAEVSLKTPGPVAEKV